MRLGCSTGGWNNLGYQHPRSSVVQLISQTVLMLRFATKPCLVGWPKRLRPFCLSLVYFLRSVRFLNVFLQFLHWQRRKLATQQGVHESYYRDMMVMFGKWEFDPMDLLPPSFPVHLWQGDEDGLVPVTLQRYICSRLKWIEYHELSKTGHYLSAVPGFGDLVLKTLLVSTSTWQLKMESGRSFGKYATKASNAQLVPILWRAWLHEQESLCNSPEIS